VSHYQDIGALRGFPEGKIRRRMVQGQEVGIVLWSGHFYAFSNRCPHADFQMNFGYFECDKLHCPIHYAEFELATGKAVYAPQGTVDIATYAVRVEDERVPKSV